MSFFPEGAQGDFEVWIYPNVLIVLKRLQSKLFWVISFGVCYDLIIKVGRIYFTTGKIFKFIRVVDLSKINKKIIKKNQMLKCYNYKPTWKKGKKKCS